MKSRPALLVACCAVVMFDPVGAIDCYQCSSTDQDNPFQCNEFLTSDISIQAEPCSAVYGARYCVKHTGRFEGGLGTKRYCSSRDLGNYCNYHNQPGDQLEYRSCVFTCSSDGCNPAGVRAVSGALLLAAVLAALTVLL
ncbi:U-scoloptoxin(05)-Sm1a [Bacillus rossius redtenbacheri]|uniref:U-scoloptoxin(05)-Sm1a n=1 Tax=Bacillus rossius redtenbacheri TaxID=93214 RepID=UPI002FDE2A4F